MLLFWLFVGIILSEYVQLISDRGSFLESIWGRSRCDSCKKNVPWYALIPLIGRFLSKGVCLSCGKKVSWKYFWFEFLFSAGWIALVVVWQGVLLGFPWLLLSVLLLYCATWLLMYEDLKHYSVPVSWLVSWGVFFIVVWLQLSYGRLYWLDTLIMVGVLALSIFVVALRKPKEERSIGSLFGMADFLVLIIFSLLLGFQATTVILLMTMINAILFLVMQKKLRTGQRLPLLTVMLPWGLIALMLLA